MIPPDPKRIGTYNQVDRSKQYTRADAPELLRSLNEAWTKIRTLERALILKEKEIGDLRKLVKRYRIANIVLTSIVTGLAWEGLKALAGLLK